MVKQGLLDHNELNIKGTVCINNDYAFLLVSGLSDNAVKKLRDDLTSKAMHYLKQVCINTINYAYTFFIHVKGKDTKK